MTFKWGEISISARAATTFKAKIIHSNFENFENTKYLRLRIFLKNSMEKKKSRFPKLAFEYKFDLNKAQRA